MKIASFKESMLIETDNETIFWYDFWLVQSSCMINKDSTYNEILQITLMIICTTHNLLSSSDACTCMQIVLLNKTDSR